jgi:hypothetical protein
MNNNEKKDVLSGLLEVTLPDPDAFLKIRETLSRIGVASKKEKILWPSCHILHKKGRYYITHFKEMFILDGHESDIESEDIYRRNMIAKLLEDWGLCTIVADKSTLTFADMDHIKVVPYKEKKDWTISPKFKMMSDRKQEKV